MKYNLFISSINPGVGKTTFALALALNLKQDGLNIGYFKPISDSVRDKDAENAKNLLGMDESLEIINPVQITPYEYDLTPEQRTEKIDEIKVAFEILSKNYDMLIIEGCRRIHYLSFLKLSARDLFSIYKAKMLIISSGADVEDIDRIILGVEFLRNSQIECIGGILSMVPVDLIEKYQETILPRLEEILNIQITGIIPNKSTLVAPSVKDLLELLDGEVILGDAYLDNLVENYVVGAMEPDTALKYFRNSERKAVITGGDRPQIAVAALETDTSCLILTGSIYPSSSILAKAELKHVPVILVKGDTFSTIKKITSSTHYGRIHQGQTQKLMAWRQMIDQIDCKTLIDKLK
ncbi:MAG: AAA family ATPase [Candidatus Heimdallarchaeota archaeon]|nr:AAA family ATPase [Candidatus Heimdallarchaeota archaeon]MDH5644745.1 AAA family ATPase [Candidatus Heimdallarchaeota archaeon]